MHEADQHPVQLAEAQEFNSSHRRHGLLLNMLRTIGNWSRQAKRAVSRDSIK